MTMDKATKVANRSEVDSVGRLSDALFHSRRPDLGTVAALPSNIRAVEAVVLFRSGLATHVAVVGPSGWGKSLLLECAATEVAPPKSAPERVFSAANTQDFDAAIDHESVLILDDVHVAMAQAKTRVKLQRLLERRIRTRKATLIAAESERASKNLAHFLPSSREWTIGTISQPTEAERTQVVMSIARQFGMSMDARLAAFVARHYPGSGQCLKGAVRKLELLPMAPSDPNFAFSACGLLFGTGCGSNGWDLRDAIQESAEAAVRSLPASDRRLSPQTLAIHLSRAKFQIPEQSIAGFYQISEGDVYRTFQQTSSQQLKSEIELLESVWMVQWDQRY